MLLASYPRETCNTFDEMPNVVIWWHSTTPCVNLERSQGLSNPRNQVFDDALMELIEDVRGDGPVNVDIR